MRGRTGCALGFFPASSEEAYTIATGLADVVPKEAHDHVRMISTDDPSGKLFAALRTVFPNLVYLCLDVVHLPMTLEYASSKRRTKCSRRLRQLMRKFEATPPTWAYVPSGVVFNGGTCQPLTLVEENKRQQVLSGALSRAAAERLLDRVDATASLEHHCLAIR